MSHSDSISSKNNLNIIATSENDNIAGFKVKNKSIYGLLFHPEVSHSEYGNNIINNFVSRICHLTHYITPSSIISNIEKNIKSIVGNEHVLMAVSGGVDSTVAATLINRVIGKRLHCVFIDNGLLRENEFQEVLTCYSNFSNSSYIL